MPTKICHNVLNHLDRTILCLPVTSRLMVEQLHIGGLPNSLAVPRRENVLLAVGAGVVLDAVKIPIAGTKLVGRRVLPGRTGRRISGPSLGMASHCRMFIERLEQWLKGRNAAGNGSNVRLKPEDLDNLVSWVAGPQIGG